MAAEVAMKAFADFVRFHSIKITDFQRASEILRVHVKAAVEPALAEAKAAFACNMGHLADATFRASMMQAGIAAAKELTGAA